MTIKEAALKVLKEKGSPLTIREIYQLIIEKNLFQFKAKNPEAVLKTEIRKHCEGLSLKTGKRDKFFVIDKEGAYTIK